MKKLLISLAIVLAVAALSSAITYSVSHPVIKKSEPIAISPITGQEILGYNQGSNNILSSVSSSVTTTNVGGPTLLLSRNATRQYCYVVNNSDTGIYLTFRNFDSQSAASSSIGSNLGLLLVANGGSYECLPENMVVSDIWATSTASGKSIVSGQQ